MSVNVKRLIVWSCGLADDFGFRQYTGGHTPEPAWTTFIAFAERYFGAPRATASRS